MFSLCWAFDDFLLWTKAKQLHGVSRTTSVMSERALVLLQRDNIYSCCVFKLVHKFPLMICQYSVNCWKWNLTELSGQLVFVLWHLDYQEQEANQGIAPCTQVASSSRWPGWIRTFTGTTFLSCTRVFTGSFLADFGSVFRNWLQTDSYKRHVSLSVSLIGISSE